jgi:ribosomal-protein-alanine N-acetyltransferase
LVQLRPAIPADVPALLAVEQEAPAAAHWSEGDYRRLFTTAGLVILVVEEGSIQGFVVSRQLGDEWEIENLVVASMARRRGLGMLLINELLDLARRHGAKSVFLEVRESNHAARRLYSKAGFLASGRRKSYYRDPEEDAILYQKIVSRGRIA